MGRTSKFDDERVNKILQALRVGATLAVAAQFAGIDETTLHRWRTRYASFASQIKEAQASAEITWLAVIERAATTSWQAAAWKLERLYPDRYALKNRVNVEHSGELDLYDGGARERLAHELDELATRRRAREALERDGTR